MHYQINKFQIAVCFKFFGDYTGNELIYDKELKQTVLFNYVTPNENISASCVPFFNNFSLNNYVEAGIRNFEKLNGKILFTKQQGNKYFVLLEAFYKKIIQIYFIRNNYLYCFSAVIPLNSNISGFNLLNYNTSKKLLQIISSITDITA